RNASVLPQHATEKLLTYCQLHDWAGYDPYDALNSELFRAIPFLNNRLIRLVLIQTLKRSPVDLRAFVRVPKTRNPKALALFLTSSLKLLRLGLLEDSDQPKALSNAIIALRSSG